MASTSVDESLDEAMTSMQDDWQAALQIRRRRKQEGERACEAVEHDTALNSDNKFEEQRGSGRGNIWAWHCVMALVALVLVLCMQLWFWFHPSPVHCNLTLVRPQSFKVDVTDFFAPKVSVVLQMGLSVQNGNFMRSMLLEQCKLVAYETTTGLKLGSGQQDSLVLSPFSSTQVTVTLQQVGAGLPQSEQRRLAADFLGKKALLLTIIATASSRLPFKGSKTSTVTTNSSKKVDLFTFTKDPFFQRAPLPPPPPPPSAAGNDLPL